MSNHNIFELFQSGNEKQFDVGDARANSIALRLVGASHEPSWASDNSFLSLAVPKFGQLTYVPQEYTVTVHRDVMIINGKHVEWMATPCASRAITKSKPCTRIGSNRLDALASLKRPKSTNSVALQALLRDYASDGVVDSTMFTFEPDGLHLSSAYANMPESVGLEANSPISAASEDMSGHNTAEILTQSTKGTIVKTSTGRRTTATVRRRRHALAIRIDKPAKLPRPFRGRGTTEDSAAFSCSALDAFLQSSHVASEVENIPTAEPAADCEFFTGTSLPAPEVPQNASLRLLIMDPHFVELALETLSMTRTFKRGRLRKRSAKCKRTKTRFLTTGRRILVEQPQPVGADDDNNDMALFLLDDEDVFAGTSGAGEFCQKQSERLEKKIGRMRTRNPSIDYSWEFTVADVACTDLHLKNTEKPNMDNESPQTMLAAKLRLQKACLIDKDANIPVHEVLRIALRLIHELGKQNSHQRSHLQRLLLQSTDLLSKIRKVSAAISMDIKAV